MKQKREYGNLERKNYRPEFTKCQDCGSKLTRSHIKWRKPIQFLSGPYYILNIGYRCSDEKCKESHPKVYSSAYAEGLSLWGSDYSLEVLVAIGNQRLRKHKTMAEIHQELVEEYGIQISERHVQNLFDEYLVLSACSHGKKLEKYRDEIARNGGIVLAIDGAKPEKGRVPPGRGLYLFRDTLSGCRLHCALLPSADQQSLSQEIQVVKKLGFEIQAVISDDERATVAAVAERLPDVPHGLCHIHFLKAVQKPVNEQEQKLAKELKRPLRELNKVERIIRHEPERTDALADAQKVALRRYLDALRSVLLTKGHAPFRLAGVTIYEALERLADSFERSLERQNHHLLDQLQQMAQTYQQQQTLYE